MEDWWERNWLESLWLTKLSYGNKLAKKKKTLRKAEAVKTNQSSKQNFNHQWFSWRKGNTQGKEWNKKRKELRKERKGGWEVLTVTVDFPSN